MTPQPLSEKIIRKQIPCPENKLGCLVFHYKEFLNVKDVKATAKRIRDRLKEKKQKVLFNWKTANMENFHKGTDEMVSWDDIEIIMSEEMGEVLE